MSTCFDIKGCAGGPSDHSALVAQLDARIWRGDLANKDVEVDGYPSWNAFVLPRITLQHSPYSIHTSRSRFVHKDLVCAAHATGPLHNLIVEPVQDARGHTRYVYVCQLRRGQTYISTILCHTGNGDYDFWGLTGRVIGPGMRRAPNNVTSAVITTRNSNVSKRQTFPNLKQTLPAASLPSSAGTSRVGISPTKRLSSGLAIDLCDDDSEDDDASAINAGASNHFTLEHQEDRTPIRKQHLRGLDGRFVKKRKLLLPPQLHDTTTRDSNAEDGGDADDDLPSAESESEDDIPLAKRKVKPAESDDDLPLARRRVSSMESDDDIPLSRRRKPARKSDPNRATDHALLPASDAESNNELSVCDAAASTKPRLQLQDIEEIPRDTPQIDYGLEVTSTSSSHNYDSTVLRMLKTAAMHAVGNWEDAETLNVDVKWQKLLSKKPQRPLYISKTRKFDGKIRQNVEAALIQMVGKEQSRDQRCYLCRHGGGIFIGCVSSNSFYDGACACCVYRCHGDIAAISCTLRKRNTKASSKANTALFTAEMGVPRAERSTTSGLFTPALQNHSTERKAAANAKTQISQQITAPWARPEENSTQIARPQNVPLAIKDPNSQANADATGLTEQEQSRLTVELSLRNNPANKVQIPFDEDCMSLRGLVKEAIEGPFRSSFGAANAAETIHAVWLSTGPDSPLVYLRPSKAKSEDGYQHFLSREVRKALSDEDKMVIINAEVEQS